MRLLHNRHPLRPQVIAAFRRRINDPMAVIEGLRANDDFTVFQAKVSQYFPNGCGPFGQKYKRLGVMRLRVFSATPFEEECQV